MDNRIVTVLNFLTAAQTTLALYSSPTGPTDPKACYDILTTLLEDPALLKAQALLTPGVILFMEQNVRAPVLTLVG